MIIKNNSTTKVYVVGGVSLAPGEQKTVPDSAFGDITGITDIAVIGGNPANGNYSNQKPMRASVDPASGVISNIMTTDGVATGFVVNVVSSTAPSNGDGRPNGTLYVQTA